MPYIECRDGAVIRLSDDIATKFEVLKYPLEQKEGTKEHPIPVNVSTDHINRILDCYRDNRDPFSDPELYDTANYLGIPLTPRGKAIRKEIERLKTSFVICSLSRVSAPLHSPATAGLHLEYYGTNKLAQLYCEKLRPLLGVREHGGYTKPATVTMLNIFPHPTDDRILYVTFHDGSPPTN